MTTPSDLARVSSMEEVRKVYKGLDRFAHKLIGRYKRRRHLFVQLQKNAVLAHRAMIALGDVSQKDLQLELHKWETRFRQRQPIPEPELVQALGAVGEQCGRILGMQPYEVQLMGALALYKGCMAEMATGEGKTLTTSLGAVLLGWTRFPFHVLTANDYLAERDAKGLATFYASCNLSVSSVIGTLEQPDRAVAYRADIVYSTGKELLADFLRDRLKLGPLTDPDCRAIRDLGPKGSRPIQTVTRGVHSAIIDEADSVLIDEAVTPLIISYPRPNPDLIDACTQADTLARKMVRDVDYTVNGRYRSIELEQHTLEKVEVATRDSGELWKSEHRREELIKQALVAREFFHKGREYVISEGKVMIVDEFTGRLMPERTWRQGMHQAIEAKEMIDISDPTETMVQMSYQRFFRFFHRLSGLTGTGAEEADEFWDVYHLPVVKIPTHRPCQRVDLKDAVYRTLAEKWDAVVDQVKQIQRTGRPLLIGTRSVRTSEHLATLLKKAGVQFEIINAIRHEDEAPIIEKAGEKGRITIATNMAGRGTDIKLGPGVVELGGLHVIATDRHDSRRVDRQLVGRAGRQGDAGSAQAFVSLDDDLIRQNIPKAIRQQLSRTLKSGDCPPLVMAAFLNAQKAANKRAQKQRAMVMTMDRWLDEALAFSQSDKESEDEGSK